MSILITNARVLTLVGPRPRRGKALGDLAVIERGDVLIRDGVIASVAETGQIKEPSGPDPEMLFSTRIRTLDLGRELERKVRSRGLDNLGELVLQSREELRGSLSEREALEVEEALKREGLALGMDLEESGGALDVIDADGRVLMPAFVDCHTHACWAGNRLDEWEMRLKGAAYLDILKAGGGIMATVRAVRAAKGEDLTAALLERLGRMLSLGSAAVEVKSGYGLDARTELKMLEAIASAAKDTSDDFPRVVATALLGHAVDADGTGSSIDAFIERTIKETLPQIHSRFPGVTVDAFCEQGAWSLDATVQLLSAARELGHPVRVHADQFNSLGMLREAVRLGARSVDHLEASTQEDLEFLAQSETFGVVLPCSGFHLDRRFADARRLVDAGGLLALATNYNPGSAPCPSMANAISLAVRFCGLTPAEAIAAATVNAAELLGLTDQGTIVEGQRADLLLLRHTDERMLAFEFGDDPVEMVLLGGQEV
jgi:imidazolonepropionase